MYLQYKHKHLFVLNHYILVKKLYECQKHPLFIKKILSVDRSSAKAPPGAQAKVAKIDLNAWVF